MSQTKISESGFLDERNFLTPIQNNILKLLEDNGSLSRPELKKILDIPRTTIYDNLLKLMKRRLIEKFPVYEKKRGRPVIKWILTE